MKSRFITPTVLASLALAGCTTLGTNVSGSFRCEAADGVCAPSTVIDDIALASIEETGSTELLNPAGPFRMDDGIDRPVHGMQTAQTDTSTRRAPLFQLSVVLPGYADLSGARHERRVVRIEAALPGRGDALDALARRSASGSRGRGLLAAAESAPLLLALADDTAADDRQAAPATDPLARIEAQVAERLAARHGPKHGPDPFSGTVE